MFYALKWFERIEIFREARRALLEWLQSGDLLFYNNGIASQIITPEDTKLVDEWLDQAWNSIAFGGFVAGRNLSDIKGFCYFELEDDTARLLGLAISKTQTTIPLMQSPIIHAAIIELLRETAKVKRLYLPLAVDVEEQELMQMHELVPDEQPGWWVKGRQGLKPDELLKAYIAPDIARWQEFNIEIEPNLLNLVNTIFAHFSYKKGVLIERSLKIRPDGYQMIDELAPVTMRSFLPLDAAVETKTAKIKQLLGYISQISPLKPLQVTERTMEEWADIWDVPAYHRVTNRLVIVRPDQIYTKKPDEIMIRIKNAFSVFGVTDFGPHPSTRMPLEMLEKYVDPTQHHKMLDIGVGTGILSIAAIGLGVQRIFALDAHPPAVETARENMVFNEIAHQVQVEQGSLAVFKAENSNWVYVFSEEALQPPQGLAEFLPVDIITCNTYDHVVISLAVPMFAALRKGGLLFSSGIHTASADLVDQALAAAGFSLVERRENGIWVGFAHQKV